MRDSHLAEILDHARGRVDERSSRAFDLAIERIEQLETEQLEKLWTVDDMAYRFQVTTGQIRRWIRDGKLTALQLAGEPQPGKTRIRDQERIVFEIASEEFSLQRGTA